MPNARCKAALIVSWVCCALPWAQGAQNVSDAHDQIQVAFTPGDDASGLITRTLYKAQKQILVHAFSFTNKAIARALLDAARRGAEVIVLADREQFEKGAAYLLADLKAGGIQVLLDGEHGAAHNKVMIVDAGTANASVVTGSFNFTQAAQKHNAENVIVIEGNAALTEAYLQNWKRHRQHSTPLH